MLDFYISKDHSQELFLLSTENLFLIFWSDLSSFCIFLSEYRPYLTQKTRALTLVSQVQFFLFHPIKNLISNLKPNLCLLLWCEGVGCVLQCCEACVF